MKKIIHATSAAAALGMLVLAGCAVPTLQETRVADASPPPTPALERVTVTGSGIARQHAAGVMGMSTFAPLPAPLVAMPGMDKFPDKEAGGLTLTADNPVSTFSADVDTASYAFVRRMLSAGRMPPAQAVRVEEMVNYFPYQYAGPESRRQPFKVSTEVMPSPWNADNQLVHIAVRGYDVKRADRPLANVVLLVDVSGSMAPPDRLPLLKKSLGMFAAQLRDNDRVAIVTYANGTRVALEPTLGKDRDKIVEAIDSLGAGGGTAGGEGLERAYAMAERHFDPKAVNRVILATDGDFNLGITDPKELERFIAAKRKTGVYLSVFGVGLGNLNDALIQRLTQSGNGNAAYLDTILEARKALSEELGSTMFPIANDVKFQVEFNPARVAAYRLVGYETRMLRREDFKDDKVDAGDMGAGHSVTAIYEITPASALGKLVDPLRYPPAGGSASAAAAGRGQGASDELCFVKLRYKLPGEAASLLVEHPVRASSARKSIGAVPVEQRFAVAVAAFGQKLRAEKAVEGMSFAEIAALANGARGADDAGYRAEFVRLVRAAEAMSASAGPGQR